MKNINFLFSNLVLNLLVALALSIFVVTKFDVPLNRLFSIESTIYLLYLVILFVLSYFNIKYTDKLSNLKILFLSPLVGGVLAALFILTSDNSANLFDIEYLRKDVFLSGVVVYFMGCLLCSFVLSKFTKSPKGSLS